MFSVQRYLDENYKDNLYSEMLYRQAVVQGANAVSKIDYAQRGAKCILISSLIISIPADVAAVATFTDATNRTLFQIDVIQNNSGIYEFWKIQDGSQLFLNCDNNTVKFSVAHQYLTVREIDKGIKGK